MDGLRPHLSCYGRATRLHTLPQYLHFQLKRFVFDMETLERKKAADPFSFPAEVDLGPHCTPLPASCERGESPATQREAGSDYFKYQLAAILMHKGASASHGHYVAHVQVQPGEARRMDDRRIVHLLDSTNEICGDRRDRLGVGGFIK